MPLGMSGMQLLGIAKTGIRKTKNFMLGGYAGAKPKGAGALTRGSAVKGPNKSRTMLGTGVKMMKAGARKGMRRMGVGAGQRGMLMKGGAVMAGATALQGGSMLNNVRKKRNKTAGLRKGGYTKGGSALY